MSRLYVFADETGDMTFRAGPNISKYFILCSIALDDCRIGDRLSDLRREMAWRRLPLGQYFHATTDQQSVRDEVFNFLEKEDFDIDATILQKNKA